MQNAEYVEGREERKKQLQCKKPQQQGKLENEVEGSRLFLRVCQNKKRIEKEGIATRQ